MTIAMTRLPTFATEHADRAPAAAPRNEPSRLVALLTERERDVVGLVALGLSNDEIAERWFVSQATVRAHVSRAMTRLHARDRAQLVVIAYQHGLAEPPPPDA